MENLRYPIGKFQMPENFTKENIDTWIQEIDNAPEQYGDMIFGWTDGQLDTPYRPEGWTVRQLIHHVADSHMNSYIRFKWTLTENEPTIKAYDEKLWAELPEAKTAPVELSLGLIYSLHARWVMMLRNLSEDDLKKKFIHPESGKAIALNTMVALYAWHGKHHLAHIEGLRERMGW